MSRFIDADELLNDLVFPTEQFKKAFTELINDTPTVEARPIVRCKDCKYFDEMEDTEQPGYRECHYFSNWTNAYYMLPDDGCTCGERKEEGGRNDRT